MGVGSVKAEETVISVRRIGKKERLVFQRNEIS
jgi:hypothetical protein